MADRSATTRLLASDHPETGSQEAEMHPFALYLAATDIERNYVGSGRNRQAQFAVVDAPPLAEPAPASRLGRLTAILRRRVARAGGA